MATSFVDQIPTVIHIIARLKPKRIIDIGKGFGKYGFLIHEYCGIDTAKAPNPRATMAEQSRIHIDAVDINPDYTFPHLDQFYSRIFEGDVLDFYRELPVYDFVLMADVIEHLAKTPALDLLRHFLASKATVLVTTPAKFFQQTLYDSEAERHQSFWNREDFAQLGYHVEAQRVEAGVIYLISPKAIDIRGFGSSFQKRIRRVARAMRNEL